LKQAYTKFHDKGFEIISVSLDDKKPNWTNALNQYQMPWVHISDVKGFNSRVNELYYVPSIPKTLLLDKTGKIIAKDLRGPALDAKLAELLK
jgi:alkyl hydroperoxide reductase subunit AhpC